MSGNNILITILIGLMMPEVPLVIYDPTGVRHVIGTAEVEPSGEGFEITGKIVDPFFQNILKDESWPGNPDNYSIGFDDDSNVVEASMAPPETIPATKRTNSNNAQFKGRIPNHDS